MNVSMAENELFSRWINTDNIVKDGLVDEISYKKTPIKILVIMKETYGGLSEWNNDLRVFLRNGARWQTWNNIVRWTYGLQNIEKNIDDIWNLVNKVNHEDRIQQLKTICSINLKKRPGGASTNPSELNDEAKNDIELLKEQVMLYSPDIVLCGGKQVGDLVQEMNLFGDIKFKDDGLVRAAISNEKTVIISYVHPQVRGKGSGKEELFKNLIQSFQNHNLSIRGKQL